MTGAKAHDRTTVTPDIFRFSIMMILRTIQMMILSHSWDSNPRPTRYECVALPTELKWL